MIVITVRHKVRLIILNVTAGVEQDHRSSRRELVVNIATFLKKCCIFLLLNL